MMKKKNGDKNGNILQLTIMWFCLCSNKIDGSRQQNFSSMMVRQHTAEVLQINEQPFESDMNSHPSRVRKPMCMYCSL